MNAYSRTSLTLLALLALQGVVFAQTNTNVTTPGGTSGKIPIFTGSTAIGDSAITQVNGDVGIGTAAPVDTLTVVGGLTSTGSGSVINLFATNPPGSVALDLEPIYSQDNLSGGYASFYTQTHLSGTLNGDFSDTYIDTPWVTATTGIAQSAGVWIADRRGIGTEWNTGVEVADQGTGAKDYAIRVEGGKSFFGGNVGVGTELPTSKLEVNGNLKLTSGSGASMTFADGTTQATAWTGVLCGGDYAEAMTAAGGKEKYAPGDVMVLTGGGPNDIEKSTEPYSTMVAGIFATKPGVVGRRSAVAEATNDVPMAMIGVVPTKVSAENGPIHRGDLLVSSSTPGYAMKGTDRSRMLGAVIGKAMGSLDSGKGVIEVLVALQ